MSQPQTRVQDYLDRTRQEDQALTTRLSETMNHVGVGVIVGIETGDWSGFAMTFDLLQDAAFEAIRSRRHARFADQLFGGAR